MKFLTTTMMTGFAALALLAAATPAAASPSTDKAQIEAIIKDYLIQHPEVIQQALDELDRRDEAAFMASVRDAIENDPRDVKIGPDNAKVTIVEFFDYNCSFCKVSTGWLADTIAKYPKDVQVIFKELPILDSRTGTSRNAAKAAIAAHKQGKYLPMHVALMESSGLTEERIKSLAKESGVNVRRMEKDSMNAEVDALLEDTLVLANRIPSLTGTPFFIINDMMIAGADVDRLQASLEAALEG